VHWAAWEIPPSTRSIDGKLPDGARQGANSFGGARYNGPCPPKGDDPHRYSFIVYALSAPLDLEKGTGAREVRKKIAKLAVARGETFGTFGR
jgi:Raf kinase inhibitor-like YbhB/YbcL family protein